MTGFVFSRTNTPSPDVSVALDQARTNQLAAASLYEGQPAPLYDVEEAAWEQVAVLSRWMGPAGPQVPSIGTAAGLVRTFGYPVLPVDPATLAPRPGVGPLRTVSAIVDHYEVHKADGVALLSGPQPSGGLSLLAVKASSLAAWRSWLNENGTDLRRELDDDGRVVREYREGRDLGRVCMIRWLAPRGPQARTVVARGTAAINKVTTEMLTGRVQEAAEQSVTLVWPTPHRWLHAPVFGDAASCGCPACAAAERPVLSPGVQQQATIRKGRSLGPGVQALPDGTPLLVGVVRPDGWHSDVAAPLIAPSDPPPSWLLDKIGAKWVELAAVAA